MKFIRFFLTVVTIAACVCNTALWADDLEAYQGGGTDAKVLLVLDASGSMLLEDAPGGGQVSEFSETRMQTLYNALNAVLNDPELANNPDLGVGLSWYGGVTGSGIKFPVTPLATEASSLIPEAPEDMLVKEVILNMVDGIFPRDEEIYEAGAIDLVQSGFYNSTYGYVYMENVPECKDMLIADQDWSLTGGEHPPYWTERVPKQPTDNGEPPPSGTLLPIDDTEGSYWTSDYMPMSWVQTCPEPPDFSGQNSFYCPKKAGEGVCTPSELKPLIKCDKSGQGWDPDECKVNGYLMLAADGVDGRPEHESGNGIAPDTLGLWPVGGHPGEWSYCVPGEPVEVEEVHACESTFFTLYNDTRELLTPTTDALYEAARYFRGDRVYQGSRDHFPSWNNTVAKPRYVDLPVPALDYPDGHTTDLDYPTTFEHAHGFPGNLEHLGVSDKMIFTENHHSSGKVTGGLWGWRAANPLTYVDHDDPNSNAGPRRRYIPISEWAGADASDDPESRHTLDNAIFQYDCDYRIGKTRAKDDEHGTYDYDQWSYLFNSFYSCNLVEGESILAYPKTTDIDELEKIRFGENGCQGNGNNKWCGDDDENALGNEINPGTTVSPTEVADVEMDPADGYFHCVEELIKTKYCPDDGVTGDLSNGNSGSNDGCSVPKLETSHWERKCDFRYESTKNYVSPIGECSNSSIILVSDGHPTANTIDNNDYGAAELHTEIDQTLRLDEIYGSNVRDPKIRLDTPGLIRSLTGQDSCETIFSGLGSPADNDSVLLTTKHEINKSGACAFELAEFLATTNQRPGNANIGTVKTHTVGFQLSADDPALAFLEGLAEAGGGEYASATNEQQLIDAIKAMIVASSKDTADTSSVAISLDSNKLTASRYVFAPVFKSKNDPIWDANVKGYFLYAEEDTELDRVIDKGSRSFWYDESGIADPASRVLAGGLNEAIVPTSVMNQIKLGTPREEWEYPDHNNSARKIYIETEDWPSSPGAPKYQMLEDLSAQQLGVNNSTKSDVLDWFFAQPLADSLHSKPELIEFEDYGKWLFVVSNRGLFHGFKLNEEVATFVPDEKWAWMPNSLVSTIKQQYNGNNASHIYGLDAPMRFWRPVVDGQKKTYLFLGMRRGGSAYYMIDLTNPENPQVVWRLDANSPGFSKLGDTWSPISVFKTHKEETATGSGEFTDKYLAVFGGGYHKSDDDQETVRDKNATDSDGDTPFEDFPHTKGKKGRGIYLIDPLTGNLVKSMGRNGNFFDINVPGLAWGVPSEIRTIDADGNGFADRLYFGDMGGQLWRIDIDASEGVTTDAAYKIKRLADFGLEPTGTEGEPGGVEHHRRFYNAPAIARLKTGELAIAIGSGYRAHPLNGINRKPPTEPDSLGELYPVIQDRFYMLRDAGDLSTSIDEQNAVTEMDMYDATANDAGSSDESTRTTALNSILSTAGWYIKLKDTENDAWVGEKVLSSPVIFLGKVLFTTTLPNGEGGACTYTPTSNRFWSLNLYDATPSGDLLEDDEIDDATLGNTPTAVRWAEIDTDDAIVDQVTIASTGNLDCAPGEECNEETNEASAAEECGQVFAGKTQVGRFCYEPSRVFWKETGRSAVDCRFDTAEVCGNIVEDPDIN